MAGNKQRNNQLYRVVAICTLYPLHGGQCGLFCDKVVFSLLSLNHSVAIHLGGEVMDDAGDAQFVSSEMSQLSTDVIITLPLGFVSSRPEKADAVGIQQHWTGFMFRSP